MKRFNKFLLRSKKYFITHQSHFLFLLIMGFVIYFFSTLPYFNIIFFPEGSIMLFIILSIIILSLNEKTVFYSALFLLLLIPIFLVIKNNFLAEKTGNIAYFILIIGFIQSFGKYFKKIKDESKKNQ